MTPFSRTLAFLDAEDRSRPGRVVAISTLLLAAWLAWLGFSKTNVYAVSQDGRLLAAGAASPVQTPVAGVVADARLVLGQEVHAGDVLLVLDSSAETLRRDEEVARLEGLGQAIHSLELIIDAERGLANANERAQASRIGSATARASAAADVAALAKQQDDAIKRLKEASLVSGMEALKAAEETQRERGQLKIHRADTALAAADLVRVRKETEVRILNLDRELAELKSRVLATRAVIAQLEWEIARRRLLAPVDGTVADILPLPKGAAVGANQVLATVVPQTKMRWIGYFPVREAVGRIQPGQSARIRLDAFPWTAYGPLTAKVSAVGSEPREQRVRVEFELDPETSGQSSIPLAHGMTGATDVAIDETSPLQLLLRLSGQMVQGAGAPRASTRPASSSSSGAIEGESLRL